MAEENDVQKNFLADGPNPLEEHCDFCGAIIPPGAGLITRERFICYVYCLDPRCLDARKGGQT